MVGQAIQKTVAMSQGLRPFNPARDASAVTLLLEQTFRDDLGLLHAWARVPLLRNVGAMMWAASFMPALPDALLGFVWEENRRIVGNVTLTPDDGRHRWLVSNVAVDQKFRRRGLARQLMEAALLEARRRGAQWVLLNVRPHNIGAIELYDRLGFEIIDTEMNYIHRRGARFDVNPYPLRRLQRKEHRAAYDLARAGVSERLKMFRPARTADFALTLEDQLAEWLMDLFIGQSSERWGYFEEGQLRATVFLRAQRMGSPHALDIRVHPLARGRLEDGMVAFVRARLAQFPRRELAARALTSHKELVDSLSRAGFIPTRGLTLMAKGIK